MGKRKRKRKRKTVSNKREETETENHKRNPGDDYYHGSLVLFGCCYKSASA
jgi:hypothetical protein